MEMGQPAGAVPFGDLGWIVWRAYPGLTLRLRSGQAGAVVWRPYGTRARWPWARLDSQRELRPDTTGPMDSRGRRTLHEFLEDEGGAAGCIAPTSRKGREKWGTQLKPGSVCDGLWHDWKSCPSRSSRPQSVSEPRRCRTGVSDAHGQSQRQNQRRRWTRPWFPLLAKEARNGAPAVFLAEAEVTDKDQSQRQRTGVSAPHGQNERQKVCPQGLKPAVKDNPLIAAEKRCATQRRVQD
jgi:hypothetical protein